MPSVVQHAVSEPGTGVSSPQTLAFGSNTTAGNLIVVVTGNATSVTFNTPSDGANSYSACAGASTSGLGQQLAMYYAPTIAGGAVTVSTSWTGTSGYLCFYIFELSGVNSYDNGAGNTQQTTTNSTTGNFNATQSGIIIASTFNGSDATGVGPGYTLIQLTGSYFDVLEYTLSSPGTQNAQATMDGSNQIWSIVAGNFYQYAPPPPPSVVGQIFSAAGW